MDQKGVMEMFDELKTVARRVTGRHALRGLLADCHRLLSERGEANSVAIASDLVTRFDSLPDEQRAAFFERLALDFSPDPKVVLKSAQAYVTAPGAQTLVELTRAAEPPRQELFRRINLAAGGTAALVRMRRAVLERLPKQPELLALESDLLHLLSSWFNPGFLQMRRVDWHAPAQLLEQLIRHEAVHEIDGWDDLRRRLLPDRRCFAFFHPQLPDEPLIFVEVALLPEIPVAIAPLIDKKSAAATPDTFKVAAFYSISNCQPGLRGVSLGNFLIKRVAEELKRELPQIKTFCTLSPVPGFVAWLASNVDVLTLPGIQRAVAERAIEARTTLAAACNGEWSRLASTPALEALDEPTRQALLRLCAVYLVYQTPTPQGDPVARFHLDNGARLEQLDPMGNLSRAGLRQSFALMVNYLYDLKKVETSHESFTRGKVVYSRAVGALL
jgi:malonyl-CoA decarboxylase